MKEKKIIPLGDGGTVTKISSKFKISPKVRIRHALYKAVTELDLLKEVKQ